MHGLDFGPKIIGAHCAFIRDCRVDHTHVLVNTAFLFEVNTLAVDNLKKEGQFEKWQKGKQQIVGSITSVTNCVTLRARLTFGHVWSLHSIIVLPDIFWHFKIVFGHFQLTLSCMSCLTKNTANSWIPGIFYVVLKVCKMVVNVLKNWHTLTLTVVGPLRRQFIDIHI